MQLKLAFWLFAVASLSRALILILELAGILPWLWLTRWHLMFAPQPIVFADPLFYNPSYICIESTAGDETCSRSTEYVSRELPEPYIVAGAPFMHATIGYLRFPDTDFGYVGGQFLRREICRPGVARFWIAREEIKKGRREDAYAFNCDR